ncbi:response regulator transcription factor [Sinomicrobium soli]|uniref:response regulator transcription factor n=1 Tax=Sinomicrobium sp. N-1-3-6 TaxID=2219864 RepID=UPI000DCEDFD2|nr:response regulator transcription factor [Sinomicrobium sp. N-1-3-6]RAV27602.1 DNA-binding response regulator [Sinomicrobium sp. N-1-3-6]
MIKILLADDHVVVREGLRLILSRFSDIMVVAEAGDGNEAVEKIRHYQPDVAFLDITMPHMDGFEVMKVLNREKSDTRFIVLTMHDSISYYEKAMKAGASAYLVKGCSTEEFKACIEAVCRGENYVSTEIRKQLDQADNESHTLTPREIEVLKLMVEGNTNKSIAGVLCCSEKNVEKLKTNIRKKLDLPSHYGALLSWAIRNKVFL